MKNENSVILIGLYILKVKTENLSEVAGEHQESNTGLIQLRWWLLHPCNIIFSNFHLFSPYFSFIVFNVYWLNKPQTLSGFILFVFSEFVTTDGYSTMFTSYFNCLRCQKINENIKYIHNQDNSIKA